jgi:hypothetical protein
MELHLEDKLKYVGKGIRTVAMGVGITVGILTIPSLIYFETMIERDIRYNKTNIQPDQVEIYKVNNTWNPNSDHIKIDRIKDRDEVMKCNGRWGPFVRGLPQMLYRWEHFIDGGEYGEKDGRVDAIKLRAWSTTDLDYFFNEQEKRGFKVLETYRDMRSFSGYEVPLILTREKYGDIISNEFQVGDQVLQQLKEDPRFTDYFKIPLIEKSSFNRRGMR